MRSDIICVMAMFQSAPLTDVRGDCQTRLAVTAEWLFQSAPLTDVRGDMAPSPNPPSSVWFQSAPLTDVRGDPPLSVKSSHFLLVSIRSPHGCKGRYFNFNDLRMFGQVSIRSPHGCKGRYPNQTSFLE